MRAPFPYLGNGWTVCTEIWYVIRDQLVRQLTLTSARSSPKRHLTGFPLFYFYFKYFASPKPGDIFAKYPERTQQVLKRLTNFCDASLHLGRCDSPIITVTMVTMIGTHWLKITKCKTSLSQPAGFEGSRIDQVGFGSPSLIHGSGLGFVTVHTILAAETNWRMRHVPNHQRREL